MVCVELLTAVKRSLTTGTKTHIQENKSSFGWVLLQRKLKDLVSPLPPSTYKPANSMYIILFYATADYYAHVQSVHASCSVSWCVHVRDTGPLITHIGFFACFHAISFERSGFSKIATLFFMPL